MTPVQCRVSGGHPPLVGLSGGIGSGKSTVARLFAEHGVPTLDADAIYHDLLAADPDLAAGIALLFGPAVLDARGRVDRGALRRALAVDPSRFAPLEALSHPRVMAEVGRRAALCRTCASFGLVEVPLLFEARLEGGFAATVYVVAPLDERFERVHAQRGLPRVEFDAIVARQVPPDEGAARADVVVTNAGGPEQLDHAVQIALHSVNALLARRATT